MIRENERDYTNPAKIKKLEDIPKVRKGEVVNCTSLNIRNKPDKSSDVKRIIIADTILEYEDLNEHWCKVWFEGEEGYAMKSYIKEI